MCIGEKTLKSETVRNPVLKCSAYAVLVKQLKLNNTERVTLMERVEAMPFMFIPDSPENIIRYHKDMVYRIAFTYCRNSSDAEDVTQEVFLRYLKKTPNFTGEDHLKAWLIRVTVNISKSLLRSAWFRRTVPIDDMEPSNADDISSADGIPGMDTRNAVMSLPEKYRSIVLLYYFEDYSVREIAKLLRRTETAVQTQLQRARAMLKDKLKEEWQDD